MFKVIMLTAVLLTPVYAGSYFVCSNGLVVMKASECLADKIK